jgi:hypothetical protein
LGEGQVQLLRSGEGRHGRGRHRTCRLGSGRRSGRVNGPDIVRTAACVTRDACNKVATLIEPLQGPARQALAIATGSARHCLVADLMA